MATIPKRDRLLSRNDVQQLVAAGKIVVISNGTVLQLDSWLKSHPGGDLAILHMVGRDATDEIAAYHSEKALKMMKPFQIGRIEGTWVNLQPPIQVNPLNCSAKNISLREKCLEVDGGESVVGLDQCVGSGRSNNNTCDQKSRNTPSPQPMAVDPTQAYGLENRKAPRQTRAEYTAATEQAEIDHDIAEFPSLDTDTQQNIIRKYRELHDRVREAGHYDCRYIEYAKECCRYSALFAAFFITLKYEWFMTSACFLGLFWHQIMFTAHDAGHMGITHNFLIDSLIGIFIADFCCGLSIGWWKRSHNVHHLVTNHPEHDPDIQNVPVLATSPSFFRSVHSSYYDFTFHWDKAAEFLVPIQHYTYYPIMCIARFNLYLLSWIFLIRHKSPSLGSARWTRSTELLFMACYWYWFGYLLLWCTLPTWGTRIAFVLLSHVITFPLHVQITLSHFAMSTADLGPTESFPQKMLRTTMDVDCPAWLDFIHGGLQFQAVHHLFPRVPRHNLRRVQSLVRVFCEEVGIEYKIFGFVDGNKEVLGRLSEVGKQVEMLVACHNHMAETGEVFH